jgi:hypothetical protein
VCSKAARSVNCPSIVRRGSHSEAQPSLTITGSSQMKQDMDSVCIYS